VHVPALLQSLPREDLNTNLWLARSFHDRIEMDRGDLKHSLSRLKVLQANCVAADRLLTLARPRTARQRERVAFWQWAVRVLSFYATHAPAWLKGQSPASSLKDMRPLAALSDRLLRRLYTDHTVKEEQQNRFGWLES